jgi:hypothetical protein
MPEGTVMKAIVQDTYGSRHRGVPGAGCRPPGTIPHLTGAVPTFGPVGTVLAAATTAAW